MTYYQKAIGEYLAKRNIVGFDPRHIEGYMRLQHDILSRLSRSAFNREIRLCVECIKEGGVDAAERNARSFGL